MAIGYRAHNRAYCKTVEVVVNEYEHAKNKCSKHCAGTCLDVCLSPVSECYGAACLVDKSNKNSKLNEEYKDSCAVSNSGDKTVVYCEIKCSRKREVRSEKCAGYNTHEK